MFYFFKIWEFIIFEFEKGLERRGRVVSVCFDALFALFSLFDFLFVLLVFLIYFFFLLVCFGSFLNIFFMVHSFSKTTN